MGNCKLMYLALTGLELDFIADTDFTCLGLWASCYRSNGFRNRSDIHFIDDPWNDRHKLISDYQYLSDLHQRVLRSLMNHLNDLHATNHSKRYWQILLDPWLCTYLANLYDKWLRLEAAFACNSHYRIATPIEDFPDQQSFFSGEINQLNQDDEWNHNLLLSMINHAYKDSVVIDQLDNFKSRSKARVREKIIIKGRIYYVIKILIDNFTRLLFSFGIYNDIYLMINYLRPLSLARLNINLSQIPFYGFNFTNNPGDIELDCTKIEFESIDVELGESLFERFVSKRIVRDLPLEFTSGFKHLSKNARRYYIPRVIVSDNAHWFNTSFKHWMAYAHERGSKIITSQHGGSLCEGNTNQMFFQEAISDHYITWSVPIVENHIQLPPLKLANRKLKSSSKNKGSISFLGLDRPRYLLRCGSTAESTAIESCDTNINGSQHGSHSMSGNVLFCCTCSDSETSCDFANSFSPIHSHTHMVTSWR